MPDFETLVGSNWFVMKKQVYVLIGGVFMGWEGLKRRATFPFYGYEQN